MHKQKKFLLATNHPEMMKNVKQFKQLEEELGRRRDICEYENGILSYKEENEDCVFEILHKHFTFL